jgi:hypothetical protein
LTSITVSADILAPSWFPYAVRSFGPWHQPDADRGSILAEAEASFDFGLAWVLDGVEAFIVGRGEAAPIDSSLRFVRRIGP